MLKTLKQITEENLDSKNIQLASVTKEIGFRIYGEEEMSTVVQPLEGNEPGGDRPAGVALRTLRGVQDLPA